MREKLREALESILIGAIILVLVQTFLEDFAVISGWPWGVRKLLVFTGFFFDLLFTVEFLTRCSAAVYRAKGYEYFVGNRGWIDFLASIPLLLLGSGPAVLSVLTGRAVLVPMGGVLNALKVVKAVRIARVLRLLRVLKIFRQIKYTGSTMGQRHVTRIASLIVTNVVFVVFVVGFVFAATGLPDAESILAREHDRTASRVVDLAAGGSISDAKLSGVAAEAPDLLIVKEQGETVYSRYTNEFYFRWFGTGDYRYVDAGRYGLFFDMRTLNVLESKTNILVLVMIIFLVLALLVVYSPHFALTVTDPLHIMRKGLEDPSYNHEVDIPGKYRDDDIYRLAFLYNSVYLPLKDRNRDEAVAKCSLLDFDDMKDLLGDEV